MSKRSRTAKLKVHREQGYESSRRLPWTWIIYRNGHFSITPPVGRRFATQQAAFCAALRAADYNGLTDELREQIDVLRRKIARDAKRPVHDYRKQAQK